MKLLHLSTIKLFCCMVLIPSVIYTSVEAQTMLQSHAVNISLTGTSSLHDWEMKAANGTSQASFVLSNSGIITSISKLDFSLAAKSLKSDHKAMDKNTYKALNADKNPNISFVLTSATVTPTQGNTYELRCFGKMTIAGTTKDTELTATAKYSPADKSFKVTGIKKMKMTDYNVKPPTAMLGTIKTGNDISIAYNLEFTR